MEEDVEEEQPPPMLTERSSPRPADAWELCSSEGHEEPGVGETQHRAQLTDSQDKASIKADDAREGDLGQRVDAEQFQQKGDRIQSLLNGGRGEMQENGGCLDNRSFNRNEDTGAEESAAGALAEGDRQRMDKTAIKGKTTEGEHDTVSHGDKAELGKEDCDIHLWLRQEEEAEEQMLQRNAAVEFPASEKEGVSTVSEQQVRNQFVLMEQSADDNQNRNLPEGQVVTFGKPENAANLTTTQSSDDEREKSGVMSDGHPAVLTPTHCSVNDTFIHEVQAGQEKDSCEIEDEECYKETSHSSALVAVNSINTVGRVTSGEVFKNMLQGTCEGQQVLSQGLNPPPSEEVQRGFPEHNNEQRQDENTTQRFLEERDPEECQAVFLPEEMEDKQRMQNSCSSTTSDSLLLAECVVEEQQTNDKIQEASDLTSGDHHGLLQLTAATWLQEKEAPLVESGKQEILFDTVRTEIKHLEEEPEATSTELRGGTEELLAEIEKNDACEVHACEGGQETQEVVTFTEETVEFFEDKKQEMAETSSRSSSLVEDFRESVLVRQEVGTEAVSEEDTGETQDVGLNMEQFGFKDENIASKDESKTTNEKQILNTAVASLSNTDSGSTSGGESEAQQSKAINNDTVSKSTAKDMTVALAEETEQHATMIYIEETSLSSAQELIDEDTFDPWIQTVSQDTDGVRWQEEPEPRQQVGWKTEPLDSDGDEISSDLTESEDQFVKLSQSGASEFRSDAGMSSCTEQSAPGEHAHCESEDESQLWTVNTTGSLVGTTSDMLESDVSQICTPGPTTESLDILMEEISEIQQSHPRQAGHLNQEMVESQRNFSEKSGSQSDVEEPEPTGQTETQILKEDLQFSTEMDTFVQVTKVDEDTPKDTASNSGDEEAESGPCRSSSEVSLEEENVSAECETSSQGGTESSRLLKLSLMGTPQVGLSEDNVDALPRLNRTQLTKGSRNQMEVLYHNLCTYI